MKKTYILILFIACAYSTVSAQWNSINSMTITRAEHVAANLPGGNVLVAGGWNYVSNLTSAEIYDPSGNVWNATGVPMNSAHSAGAAVTLANGKVLVIGGYTGSTNTTACEIYDPVADTWTTTGSLTTGRSYFTATVLNSGKVLVAGGYNPSVGYQVTTAELYDPTAGTWSSGGTLVIARSYHSAALLNNGKVLIAGGLGTVATLLNQLMATEIYDPVANTWSAAADMNSRRDFFGMSKMADGKVMVSGGRTFIGSSSYLGTTGVEIYNPTNNTWTPGQDLPSRLCYNEQVTMNDGNILCVAGLDSINLTSGLSIKGITYLYDNIGSFWNAAPPTIDGRYEFPAILMADSRVMISGGVDASAEVYGTAVGVPQINNAKSLTIYPNPAKNQFTIYGLQLTSSSPSSGGFTNAKLELFNTLGESVYETKLQASSSKLQTVDVSSLKAGVYFLKIHSSDQEIVQQLTITN